jgi:hypothetical protein
LFRVFFFFFIRQCYYVVQEWSWLILGAILINTLSPLSPPPHPIPSPIVSKCTQMGPELTPDLSASSPLGPLDTRTIYRNTNLPLLLPLLLLHFCKFPSSFPLSY